MEDIYSPGNVEFLEQAAFLISKLNNAIHHATVARAPVAAVLFPSISCSKSLYVCLQGNLRTYLPPSLKALKASNSPPRKKTIQIVNREILFKYVHLLVKTVKIPQQMPTDQEQFWEAL